MKSEKKLYYTFSLNSSINSALTTKVENPINLEISNGRWNEVIIEEGFIVIRCPQTYELSQLPTSFQIISFQGTSDYVGDNITASDTIGVFLVENSVTIPLAGNNDVYSYTYKLLNKIVLNNVNNNMQLHIVGRVVNATFPTTNELFENRQYKNGLYYVNFNWNATGCYFAIYLKMKLT